MQSIQSFFSERGLRYPFWPNNRTILETIINHHEFSSIKDGFNDNYGTSVIVMDFFNKSGGFQLQNPALYFENFDKLPGETKDFWLDLLSITFFHYNAISKNFSCEINKEGFQNKKIENRMLRLKIKELASDEILLKCLFLDQPAKTNCLTKHISHFFIEQTELNEIKNSLEMDFPVLVQTYFKAK